MRINQGALPNASYRQSSQGRLSRSLAEQSLDHSVTAYVETGRALIELAQQALSQIDINTMDPPDYRELVGKINGNVFPAGSLLGDLIRC